MHLEGTLEGRVQKGATFEIKEGRKEMFYLTTHSTHFIYGYMEGRKEMFYLTTHSTHFIYGYMASDIWLKTIQIAIEETRCRHMGYSFRLTARVLLYAPSHRQDNTYHGLCHASRGAQAGTRNSSMWPLHEGSIREPITPRNQDFKLCYLVALCSNLKKKKYINWFYISIYKNEEM